MSIAFPYGLTALLVRGFHQPPVCAGPRDASRPREQGRFRPSAVARNRDPVPRVLQRGAVARGAEPIRSAPGATYAHDAGPLPARSRTPGERLPTTGHRSKR
ncbi:hypothetical protein GCM10022244_17870 [Streptomyces gulbargensis]|uniref:Uncharacterized protein n=1 Tax=Streptomyces gulbargensis TaxID=364901 RepID=A0ABP7LZ15_9ACTN